MLVGMMTLGLSWKPRLIRPSGTPFKYLKLFLALQNLNSFSVHLRVNALPQQPLFHRKRDRNVYMTPLPISHLHTHQTLTTMNFFPLWILVPTAMSIKMKTRGIDPLVASQAGTDESGFPQYNIQTPTLTSQGPDPTSGSKYKAITVKWDRPYMVNWSPKLGTAVSDLEVEYAEEPGFLYTFK